MDIIKAILDRRSIRKYNEKPVPKEIVNQLLKAAMYAPSARNYRPWHFIVADDRRILDDLSELHPYAKMLKQATLAIIVCGDLSVEKEEGYLAVNCAAATQNILLAVHAHGLGSVWLGLYPRQARINDVQQYFKLPPNIQPVSLIAVGWPAEEKSRPERFEREKIHYNRWGGGKAKGLRGEGENERSGGRRAERRGQRAGSKEQRAKSGEQSAILQTKK